AATSSSSSSNTARDRCAPDRRDATGVRLTDRIVGAVHTGSAGAWQLDGAADGGEDVVGSGGEVHPGEPEHAVAVGHRLVGPPEVALEVPDPRVPAPPVQLDHQPMSPV